MAMPTYLKNAQDNYRSKFDIVQIRLPKGKKEEIEKRTGTSVNKYVNELIEKDEKKETDFPF